MFGFGKNKVSDEYFGDLDVYLHKESGCFFLDKTVRLNEINKDIILIIESHEKKSSVGQQRLFKLIESNFPIIQKNILQYLTVGRGYILTNQFADYQTESITISKETTDDKGFWELDMIYLKDGISHLLVEMRNLDPVDFSVEA